MSDLIETRTETTLPASGSKTPAEATGTDVGVIKRAQDVVLYDVAGNVLDAAGLQRETSAITDRYELTTDTTPDYTVGDFIGLIEVTDAMDRDNGICKLNGISILSKDNVGSQWDIRIFSRQPTIASATNVAYSITDANAEHEKMNFIVSLGERGQTAGGSFTWYKPLFGREIENQEPTDRLRSLFVVFIAGSPLNLSSADGLSFELHRTFR